MAARRQRRGRLRLWVGGAVEAGRLILAHAAGRLRKCRGCVVVQREWCVSGLIMIGPLRCNLVKDVQPIEQSSGWIIHTSSARRLLAGPKLIQRIDMRGGTDGACLINRHDQRFEQQVKQVFAATSLHVFKRTKPTRFSASRVS